MTPDLTWTDGQLNALNLKVLNGTELAFAASYAGKLPSSATSTTDGIYLYYSVDAQTIQGVSWARNATQWIVQEQFTANGNAGVCCFSWDTTTTVIYMTLVDLSNRLTVMWKDTNTTSGTATWANTSVIIPNVLPFSQVGCNKFLMWQNTDGTIAAEGITYSSAQTALTSNVQFQFPQKSLLGTKMWVVDVPPSQNDEELTVFTQINGSDITATTRDMSSGRYTNYVVQIPS